jgi:hypothetical protein
MPSPAIDAESIIATLNRHSVRYVVVGGFAIELWDVAVPPTQDIDVTPETSRANLRALSAALNELGAKLRISGSDPVAIPGGISAELIGQVDMLNLATDAGPLDLTIMPQGTSGYGSLVRNATDLELNGLLVPTAALEDILESKEAAGREKDFKTIPAIRAHLDSQRRRRGSG